MFIDVGCILKIKSSIRELKLSIVRIWPPMTSMAVEVISKTTSETSQTKTTTIAAAQAENVTQINESQVENSDGVDYLYVAIATESITSQSKMSTLPNYNQIDIIILECFLNINILFQFINSRQFIKSWCIIVGRNIVKRINNICVNVVTSCLNRWDIIMVNIRWRKIVIVQGRIRSDKISMASSLSLSITCYLINCFMFSGNSKLLQSSWLGSILAFWEESERIKGNK